jgi:acetoin utilization deacetylase AcuC-like enzyme
MSAVDAILDNELGGAFAFVRPPGHHAEAAHAMGFCLFNNIAIAALYAIKDRGLERVLIVDWDVHHGNGTMHTFYDSNQVLFFSVHQHPHYPGTGLVEDIGRGAGVGFSVNVPLAGGQGDAEYMQIFRRVLQPIAVEFRPDLILISAGFDAHESDPLAAISLSSRAFWEMTVVLREISAECCPGRMAALLEGGYSLTALSEGVSQVLKALMGAESELPPASGVDASELIERIIAVQKAHWGVF